MEKGNGKKSFYFKQKKNKMFVSNKRMERDLTIPNRKKKSNIHI